MYFQDPNLPYVPFDGVSLFWLACFGCGLCFFTKDMCSLIEGKKRQFAYEKVYLFAVVETVQSF